MMVSHYTAADPFKAPSSAPGGWTGLGWAGAPSPFLWSQNTALSFPVLASASGREFIRPFLF